MSDAFAVTEPGAPIAALENLTFPRYRPLLAQRPPGSVALAAVAGDVPIGLALWSELADNIRLLSIRVRPDWRRRGVARRLLAASENAMPADKPPVAYWSGSLPQAEAFERLLSAAGWGAKKLESYRCALTPAQVESWAQARTLGRISDRIGGFGWRAFADLSPDDHAAVAALEAEPCCPPTFRPSSFEAKNALWREHASVLFCRDVPVGWCLTRRAGADVWYENFWTRPEHVRSGAQIAMLLAMIRRQGELLGPHSVGRFVTSNERPGMMALTRGPFQGCLVFRDEHWVARKT